MKTFLLLFLKSYGTLQEAQIQQYLIFIIFSYFYTLTNREFLNETKNSYC